ncbi:MAG: hypothetical protein IJ812_00565, partial [Schwartzia sp.]|nr:hypothetical protein [Schwartzia sp. (in: firmicutes)]
GGGLFAKQSHSVSKGVPFGTPKNLFIYNTNPPSFQGVIFLPFEKPADFRPKTACPKRYTF